MISLIMVLNSVILTYNEMLLNKALDAEGKMYKALYEEINFYLQQKAFLKQEKYSIKLKPSWALALWIEFNDADVTTHAGNLLHRLCNEIHKQYC